MFPALCAEIRACVPSEFLVCIRCVDLSIFIQKKMIGRFLDFFGQYESNDLPRPGRSALCECF